ncbi:MAG TPA: hypothetical protein VMF67_01575 [Rhizomicrobium sp.]|nr:hypothetical protein [Rhizomicrobium sp.]
MSRARVSKVWREETPVTVDTALRLSRYFETTPSLCMGISAQFDLETVADRIDHEFKRIEPRAA